MFSIANLHVYAWSSKTRHANANANAKANAENDSCQQVKNMEQVEQSGETIIWPTISAAYSVVIRQHLTRSDTRRLPARSVMISARLKLLLIYVMTLDSTFWKSTGGSTVQSKRLLFCWCVIVLFAIHYETLWYFMILCDTVWVYYVLHSSSVKATLLLKILRRRKL